MIMKMAVSHCQRLARTFRFSVAIVSAIALGFFLPALVKAAEKSSPAVATSGKVSYYHDIRPILQANCQGCHQPAKSKGGYVMTDFKKLLAGGDSAGAAIVPSHPDQSAMLKMITPQDGEVRMPKGKPPLLDDDVALFRAWIQQGAQDDTPADARQHYDLEHPPVYL